MKTSSLYFCIILAAIILTLLTNFGHHNFLESLLFLQINSTSFYPTFENTFFTNQQWWRLITPTFLHFSLTHLIFNCLWIYILGSKLEQIDGKWIFLLIFLISGVASNAGQYFWTGEYFFGGLSGAIYGLLGYCFIVDLDQKGQRYEIPDSLYIFMFLWLLIGYTDILSFFNFGNIANTAHLIGLLSGFVMGISSSLIKKI